MVLLPSISILNALLAESLKTMQNKLTMLKCKRKIKVNRADKYLSETSHKRSVILKRLHENADALKCSTCTCRIRHIIHVAIFYKIIRLGESFGALNTF